MRHRHRNPDAPMALAVGLIVAFVVALALILSTSPQAAGKEETFKGRSASYWYHRAVLRREQRDDLQTLLVEKTLMVGRMQRALVHRPSSLEAIRLAAITYGQSYQDMLRVALCETGGSLNRYSKNPRSTASGLYQFLYPSTWNRTPYRAESVWSPYAAALAAGWMWRMGNKHEWVCR